MFNFALMLLKLTTLRQYRQILIINSDLNKFSEPELEFPGTQRVWFCFIASFVSGGISAGVFWIKRAPKDPVQFEETRWYFRETNVLLFFLFCPASLLYPVDPGSHLGPL